MMPDVPMIRAGNSACSVWQRLRFTRSVEHLPSVCFLAATERVETFSEASSHRSRRAPCRSATTWC
jgi:hypothetical protein